MRKKIFTLLMAVSCLAVSACPDANHPHMIDLGLPSGTKWACCNVGATSPEDYGDYFSWGETRTKDVYDWDSYQHGYYPGTEHIQLMDIGTNIAGKKYDAATANWGASWRMPSRVQIKELLSNTTAVWTTQNGVKGCMFTGNNGGSIFLPAAGRRWNGELIGAGSYGNYWSSNHSERDQSEIFELYFHSGSADLNGSHFCVGGQPVRPVSRK